MCLSHRLFNIRSLGSNSRSGRLIGFASRESTHWSWLGQTMTMSNGNINLPAMSTLHIMLSRIIE